MKHLLLLALLTILPACSGSAPKETPEEEEEKQPVLQKRIVGRIASVSSSGSFVLIQKYGAGTLPKEAIFQSQGEEGRQASLRPSGERVRDFFAADLIRGDVKIGDAVVAFSDPKKKKKDDLNKNISDSSQKADVQGNSEESEEKTTIKNP